MDKIINVSLDEENKALDYVMGVVSVGQKDIKTIINDINDKEYHHNFDIEEVKKVTLFLQTIKEFK
tara:strand:+ start:388 stop:585 length:198 start_codon:yes stop_codon:yes gene_type:complete